MISLKQICNELAAEIHVEGDLAREVSKAVVGDLLSFVMGSDAEGAAWVTIQSHLNVAAVAVLKDMPVIIIAAGRAPAEDLKVRCGIENITLITARDSIFDVCIKLGAMGMKG